MMLKTLSEYEKEIARVEKAIERTQSEHLKRDYTKYLRRLKGELKRITVDWVG